MNNDISTNVEQKQKEEKTKIKWNKFAYVGRQNNLLLSFSVTVPLERGAVVLLMKAAVLTQCHFIQHMHSID